MTQIWDCNIKDLGLNYQNREGNYWGLSHAEGLVPELVEVLPELVEGEPVEGELVEGLPELAEGLPELVEGPPELVEGGKSPSCLISWYCLSIFFWL